MWQQKPALDNDDDVTQWESEGGHCPPDKDLPKESQEQKESRLYNEAFWSSCSFCGSKNGKFGYKLEEHKPRCRYVGAANTTNVSRDNYSKFIEENDKHFLPMMRAYSELQLVSKRLHKLEELCKSFNLSGEFLD